MRLISSFDGPNAFLSNFHTCGVEYEGILYPSAEHAYQAAKSLDPQVREQVAKASSPGVAKQVGRHIALRSDWDRLKDGIMLDILRIKFARGTFLARQLIETQGAALVEGNWWGDTYWGVCKGSGLNKLGKILMKVRSDLLLDPTPGGRDRTTYEGK